MPLVPLWQCGHMSRASTTLDKTHAASRPLHTWDWEPVTVILQAFSLVEKAEPVQGRSTSCLRDQRTRWMQDGCKSTWISYMASNGSCFMVTWIVLKYHLLKVGLTQNWETMALWMLITIDWLYFIMCEDPHEWKIIEIAFGWGSGQIYLHTTLEGPWPHYMILEVSWDGL